MRAPDMRIGAESLGVGDVSLDDLNEDLGPDGPFLDIADVLDVGGEGSGELSVFGDTSRVEAKQLRLGVSSGSHGRMGVFRGAVVQVENLEVGVEGAADLVIVQLFRLVGS